MADAHAKERGPKNKSKEEPKERKRRDMRKKQKEEDKELRRQENRPRNANAHARGSTDREDRKKEKGRKVEEKKAAEKEQIGSGRPTPLKENGQEEGKEGGKNERDIGKKREDRRIA